MKRLTISRNGEWHRAVLYTTARSIINHGTRNRISKWQMEQAIKDGRSLNGWRIIEVAPSDIEIGRANDGTKI